MPEPKFTPGPWLRDNDGHIPIRIYVEDGRWKDSVKTILATTCELESNATWDSREDNANAHLIAAAPDLYEALKWYVENDDTNEGGHWEEDNAFWLEGMRRGIAALAKARGEAGNV